MEIDVGDVIAAAALILSAYATITTTRFNGRQKSLIDSQEKLNNLLLERQIADAVSDKRADLGATFLKLGSRKYRLKIFNKGRSAASNVMIEFPDGNEVVPESEIKQKFPLEILEQHQSVELLASIVMGTKPKHAVKLIWSDEHSDMNEKVVYPTL